ncbi:hypothetical protein EW146_g9521 [Bondarzewia mesenterica]|uniref:RRM domain-containing protein n=1 Tax=Bondarzewia mesenterica TaxID=1095465 RepID=A0A4S4L6Z6_9AGAM|nr:hypothetical protein EW146_g9521 [Bondarzewia mesenterica]
MADVAPTILPEANATEPAIDDSEEAESKEIQLMKQRVEEMEREAMKLRELQAAAESANGGSVQDGSDAGVPMETEEEKSITDGRSIFVGNVDYGATPEEIQGHFQACGTINRVTIICDKFTGHPKGYAYIEFAEPEHIDAALAMDNSLFRGRLIKGTTADVGGGDIGADTEEGFGEGLGITPTAVLAAGVEDVDSNPQIMDYRAVLLSHCCVLLQRRHLPSRSSSSTTMFSKCLRQASRAMSTTVGTYPYSKVAIIPPAPKSAPPAALLQGKGLMPYLQQVLPTPEKQKMLTTLFSRRHPDRLLPGSVLTVTLTHAPTTFSGVLISVRRRGPDTSFLLRNVIQRTGVEMQFFVSSPHLKTIQVLRQAGNASGKRGHRIKKAKLFHLRDSPEQMTAMSSGVARG